MLGQDRVTVPLDNLVEEDLGKALDLVAPEILQEEGAQLDYVEEGYNKVVVGHHKAVSLLAGSWGMWLPGVPCMVAEHLNTQEEEA